MSHDLHADRVDMCHKCLRTRTFRWDHDRQLWYCFRGTEWIGQRLMYVEGCKHEIFDAEAGFGSTSERLHNEPETGDTDCAPKGE